MVCLDKKEIDYISKSIENGSKEHYVMLKGPFGNSSRYKVSDYIEKFGKYVKAKFILKTLKDFHGTD